MSTFIRSIDKKDLDEIKKKLMTHRTSFEIFERDEHLNGFIEKPWGHEYRVYCDNLFDIWKLTIHPRQMTSMHCHIQKDTVLLCLHGSGATRFIDGTETKVSSGEMVYIPRGVFHQTIADDMGLDLIEVENPRNKFDLFRLADTYGRSATKYESEEQKHDSLSPMYEYISGVFIRHQDIESRFKFSFVSLTSEELSNNSIEWVIILDIKQHLLGVIEVFNPINKRINHFIGSDALIISSVKK